MMLMFLKSKKYSKFLLYSFLITTFGYSEIVTSNSTLATNPNNYPEYVFAGDYLLQSSGNALTVGPVYISSDYSTGLGTVKINNSDTVIFTSIIGLVSLKIKTIDVLGIATLEGDVYSNTTNIYSGGLKSIFKYYSKLNSNK